MDKYLITGCGGFIGSHLADYLLEKGANVYGTVHSRLGNAAHLKDKMPILKCDILDKASVESLVTEVKPDYVFHLAAQSLIPPSWEGAEKTLSTNIHGTLYLLDAIRKARLDPFVEVVCSSAEYGFSREGEIPVKESKEFRPSSPYGVSKVGQDMVAYLYWRAHRMRIIRVRPFYVIGPRKRPDACSDFARAIVEAEKGRRKELLVGNLEAVRDVVDIRDAVRAFCILAERGVPGEAYNLCSARGYKIGDILNRLVALSHAKVEVRQDPSRLRPLDEPVLVGDNSKLSSLNWAPEIGLDDSLQDILNYWRAQGRISSDQSVHGKEAT